MNDADDLDEVDDFPATEKADIDVMVWDTLSLERVLPSLKEYCPSPI
jgi:hypothetical protein